MHQLDQHTAGVFGVDEVDPRVRCAASGRVVEQADSLLAQALAQGVEVTDPVSQLLDARAAVEAAPLVASLMAEFLNKDDKWIQEQLAAFKKIAVHYIPLAKQY